MKDYKVRIKRKIKGNISENVTIMEASLMKTRQDAWTKEDDLLLAETVLRHIRSGSTQIKAFDEVGDALNRTSAACGFRWNAEVRPNYEDAVQLAKKQRKELKRSEAKIEKNQFSYTKISKPKFHLMSLQRNSNRLHGNLWFSSTISLIAKI